MLLDKWSPALQIRTVLLSIQALLSAPNPDDPLANDVAELWKVLSLICVPIYLIIYVPIYLICVNLCAHLFNMRSYLFAKLRVQKINLLVLEGKNWSKQPRTM